MSRSSAGQSQGMMPTSAKGTTPISMKGSPLSTKGSPLSRSTNRSGEESFSKTASADFLMCASPGDPRPSSDGEYQTTDTESFRRQGALADNTLSAYAKKKKRSSLPIMRPERAASGPEHVGILDGGRIQITLTLDDDMNSPVSKSNKSPTKKSSPKRFVGSGPRVVNVSPVTHQFGTSPVGSIQGSSVAGNKDRWRKWSTAKTKSEPRKNRRRVWTTQQEKFKEIMALASAASQIEEGEEGDRDEEDEGPAARSKDSPTRLPQLVMKEPKKEVMRMDDDDDHAGAEPDLPLSKSMGGFYLRKMPGKAHSLGSVDGEHLDVALHRVDEGRWGLRARTLDSQILLSCERPVFFANSALADPVAASHNKRRMFKRDGTVRDRFKGGQSEAEMRDRNRSASCPPLSLPVATMVALENLSLSSSLSRDSRSAMGSARDSESALSMGATEKSPSRISTTSRSPLRQFNEGGGQLFVPFELEKARSILEKEFEPREITAAEARPMTPIVNTELVLERMRKGQAAWDPVLLGGRDKYVLPKVRKAEGTPGGSFREIDTSEMSTSAMIQAHLNMLDKKATEITDESVGLFESEQEDRTQSLHAESAPLVQMWEERLVELRRIRNEILELSRMSAPIKEVTEKMQHEQLRISAVLRTGTDSRIPFILASPPLSTIIPKHPECFKSAKRRRLLEELSAHLDSRRTELATASRNATELFVRTMERIAPLEAVLKDSLAQATTSPLMGDDGSIVDRRGRGGGGPDINQLHGQIAKIHHQYSESNELMELDRVAQEMLDEMMELDRIAQYEEKVITECQDQAAMQCKIDEERQRIVEWNDLTKKIDWCYNDNPLEIGTRALTAVLAITRRILAEPDQPELRSVSSNSRVSVIQHILEARWGADVMTAFGFYHTKFLWCVPTMMPLEKMTYGCKYLCKRLDIPDHLLTLFLQRRTTTVPMELVKGMLDGFKHLQPGQDIFNESSSSSEEETSPLALPRQEEAQEEEEDEESDEEMPNKPPKERLQMRRKGYMTHVADSSSENGSEKGEGEEEDEEEKEEEGEETDDDVSRVTSRGSEKGVSGEKKKRKPGSSEDGLGLAQFHGKLNPAALKRFREKRKSIMMGAIAGADGKVVSFGDEGEGVGQLEVVDVDQDALQIQEEALEKLFESLDEDGNGYLTVSELRTALRRYRISINRTSAKEMLAEVGANGEKGMEFHTFLSVMRRLLAEGQEDDPSTLTYDELEDDQRTKVTAMLRQWLSQRASNAFTKWQGFVEAVQHKKQAVMEHYRSLCGQLRTSPGVSTVLQDWLQSRTQHALDLSKRGLSVSGLRACVCALYGWRPDFEAIEELGEEPAQYLLQNPSETFVVMLGDGVDIFTMRQDSTCGALTQLDVSDNDFRAPGTAALVHMLVKCCSTLKHFNISGNNIGETGAGQLSELLRAKEGSQFTHFKVARNRLGDAGGAVVLNAILHSDQRKSIEVLDMSHNELAENTVEVAGNLLADFKTVLLELDLSWNLIRQNCAVDVFEGLRVNRRLQVLNICWNGLGSDLAMHKLGDALKVCMLHTLNIGHCNILGTGAHLIAPGLKKNMTLQRLILDGNNIKQAGARALYKASLLAGRGDERVQLSTVDCNLGILDSQSFNKAEPAGKYSLDMSTPYDRVTFIELMSLVWEGKGVFMAFPPPRMDEKYNGDFRPYTIRLPETSEEEDWWVPETGLLEFSFGSLRTSVTSHDAMTKDELSQLVSVLGDRAKKERDRLDAIRAFCEGDTFLHFDQVVNIMETHLKENRSAERVELVRQCYNRLIEAEMAPDLLELLTQSERLAVEKHLGVLARSFTKNNPTGFYRLDLGKKPQRDICLRLLELQNSQLKLIKEMEEYYAVRAGGARGDVDRTWRNGKIDGVEHSHSCDWAVPQHGFLEVDFVQIVKPPPTAKPPDEDEFKLLEEKLQFHNNAMTQIQIIRDWSNRHYFSCAHVHMLLRLFSMETQQSLRVEVLVITYSRTVDWHGYRNLLQIIALAEYEALTRRLGATNLFDEVMAVGYYECDLAIPDQRFVAQELVHLAMVEPGENCVETQYNGVDLSIPAGWGKELPKRGLLSLYYCREQECIDKVDQDGSWNQSNPPHTVNGKVPPSYKSTFTVWFLKEFCAPGHTQPAGTDWVRKYRMRRIKGKMLKLANSGPEMFHLLDTDGGGTLDRKELAVGLFRLGVWLQPSEMQALMDALDEDGGGSIDLEEFQSFWDQTALDRDYELPKDAPLKKQERKENLLEGVPIGTPPEYLARKKKLAGSEQPPTGEEPPPDEGAGAAEEAGATGEAGATQDPTTLRRRSSGASASEGAAGVPRRRASVVSDEGAAGVPRRRSSVVGTDEGAAGMGKRRPSVAAEAQEPPGAQRAASGEGAAGLRRKSVVGEGGPAGQRRKSVVEADK